MRRLVEGFQRWLYRQTDRGRALEAPHAKAASDRQFAAADLAFRELAAVHGWDLDRLYPSKEQPK